LSLKYYDESEGLFDPSILPDLKRVGYDKSIELVRTEDLSDVSISPRKVRPAFSAIDLDLVGMRVRLPKGMELDFGGIAKGWIVEKTSNLLRTYSPICAVNAGGDINFVGTPSDGTKWRVELEDPRDSERTIAELSVGQCGVVTSSISKRTWNQNGKVRHHLIDPRTGEPAATDWLSVTVIAQQITEAEVYAKALLIGGEFEASRLAARNPSLAYITVDQEGRISGSQIGKEYLGDYEYVYRQ
jgi:FAD:protein FMN transferase